MARTLNGIDVWKFTETTASMKGIHFGFLYFMQTLENEQGSMFYSHIAVQAQFYCFSQFWQISRVPEVFLSYLISCEFDLQCLLVCAMLPECAEYQRAAGNGFLETWSLWGFGPEPQISFWWQSSNIFHVHSGRISDTFQSQPFKWMYPYAQFACLRWLFLGFKWFSTCLTSTKLVIHLPA